MKPLLLVLPLVIAALPVTASAQARPTPGQAVDPSRPAWSPRNLSTADEHRLETERLRSVADRNADMARDQSVEAQRNRAALGARSAPPPAAPITTYRVPPPAPMPPPADTRGLARPN